MWIFFATVGGLGKVPWAAGTWGSAVGFLLGMVAIRRLAWPQSLLLLVVTFIGCAFICTRAEHRLGQHDPPQVILDEVWGMASILMVLPWSASSWVRRLVAFLLFRAFDITKPPPLRHLARLPQGLGIMADDLGAAAYGLLVLWSISRLAG